MSGAEGTRTPDLISAIDALSHLSYSPNCCYSIGQCGEVVKRRNPPLFKGLRKIGPAIDALAAQDGGLDLGLQDGHGGDGKDVLGQHHQVG